MDFRPDHGFVGHLLWARYQDDEDNGDHIVYTGMGGLDKGGVQVKDQDITRGNFALQQNLESTYPKLYQTQKSSKPSKSKILQENPKRKSSKV